MEEKSLRTALGWDDDPFDIACITEADVRGQKYYDQLVDAISNNNTRLILVEGEFGVGKTFVLELLKRNPPKGTIVALAGLGTTIESITRLTVEKIHNLKPFRTETSFFGLIKKQVPLDPPRVNENELPEFIENNLKDKRIIITWDEVHRCDDDWVSFVINGLRKRNSHFILSGLKEELDNILMGTVSETSFIDRGLVRLYIDEWNLEEKKQLIEKRIRLAGGEGYAPFTEDAVEFICNRSKTPRKVLNICGSIFNYINANYRMGDDDSIPAITLGVVESFLTEDVDTLTKDKPSITSTSRKIDVDVMDKLTITERKTVNYLVGKGTITLTDVAKGMGKSSQATHSAINHIIEKAPAIIIQTQVKGKRRPQNAYRLAEDINAKLARR